jgi:hypothetical protein
MEQRQDPAFGRGHMLSHGETMHSCISALK